MIEAIKAYNGMREFLCRFIASENGSTSLEYSIFAAGIALAIVSSFGQMSQAVAAKYELIKNTLPG